MALSFILSFLVGAELWKFAKRVYPQRNNLMMGKEEVLQEDDLGVEGFFENFFQLPRAESKAG